MGNAFDDETAVELIGDGRFRARVSDSWSIGENPNGGYLSAIVVRAMQSVAPHGDPLSVTTHFLRPGTGDADAEIETEIVRSGRTVTTARGRLSQGGSQRLEVSAVLGTLGDADPPIVAMPRPDAPAPEACVPREGGSQGVALSLMDRVEVVVPSDRVDGAHGVAETLGWIRFRDGRPPDTLAAMMFADAFPPSVFGLLGRVGWVPTVEMTIHVRGVPSPGWLLGRFRTSDLRAGRLIEDGALWDSEGQLVAQIRQLGMVLT